MEYKEPPEHLITIFCQGYCKPFCETYAIFNLQELEDEVKKHPDDYASIDEFADSFCCQKCDGAFVCAIEGIANHPPDGLEAYHA